MRVAQKRDAPPGRKRAAPGRVGGGAPRRVALARAAAALFGALLVVLLALSAGEGEGPAPATTAARTPAQGASAPILPSAPPAPTPDTVAAAARVAQAATEPAIVPAPASPAALPVPAVALAAGPERAGEVVAPAASVAPGAAAPTATARAQGVLIPRAAAAAVGSGYLVQIGVFADPANALKAYEQATALGQPAYVQSRVVLGPFADRAAAERARKALQGAGGGPGVLIAPERGR